MAYAPTTPTKCLLLRAVLNDVRPIVARVIAAPDHLDIHELREVLLRLLGWTPDLGFLVRIRAQEGTSVRGKTRGIRLCDCSLRCQEKFRYIGAQAHDLPSAKRLTVVQTYATKPWRRVWKLERGSDLRTVQEL